MSIWLIGVLDATQLRGAVMSGGGTSMTATTVDSAAPKSTRRTTYVVIGLTIMALLARRSRRWRRHDRGVG